MKEHFDIIGGIVYLDKQIYTQSLTVDNDISKLTGSVCDNIFRIRPRVQCGIDSVTIDYTESDSVRVDQDPGTYIHHLQEHYHNGIRGHLIMDIGDELPTDMVINRY